MTAVDELLPVVTAHRAEVHETPAIPVLISTAVTVLVMGVIITAWVRFRSDIHKAITQGPEQGKAKR